MKLLNCNNNIRDVDDVCSIQEANEFPAYINKCLSIYLLRCYEETVTATLCNCSISTPLKRCLLPEYKY